MSTYSARELFKELGYIKWDNFNKLILRAIQMISNGVANGEIEKTTADAPIGSGAIRQVVDYLLDEKAKALICLMANSFKPNGHHIGRNETAILGLVKKWCDSKGITAHHQKNVNGFYVDLQVEGCISIEFDEPHHTEIRNRKSDHYRSNVLQQTGNSVLRFGLESDVIDIITEIERLLAAGKMVAAPVQLPEPVAAESRFTTFAGNRWRWCTVEHARAFGADKGYEVRYLYTEQQVRQLLAAHGIKEQST